VLEDYKNIPFYSNKDIEEDEDFCLVLTEDKTPMFYKEALTSPERHLW
jgi:hypothetical protein